MSAFKTDFKGNINVKVNITTPIVKIFMCNYASNNSITNLTIIFLLLLHMSTIIKKLNN